MTSAYCCFHCNQIVPIGEEHRFGKQCNPKGNQVPNFRATWLKPLLITPTCPTCGSDVRHNGQCFESPAGNHYLHVCISDPAHPPVDFHQPYPRVHMVPSRDATADELEGIDL